MKDRYLVIDLETSTKAKYGRKANPLIDKGINKIVAIGYKSAYRHFTLHHTTPGFDKIPHGVAPYNECDLVENKLQYDVLVGFNFKFDLLHLWHIEKLQDFFRAGGRIWCCQLAEFILSGQTYKYPALRELAVKKYKCPEREKKMEEYWSKGIDTFDIPEQIVIEDVYNDVADTEKVYIGQVKEAKEKGMYEVLLLKMDELCATTEIEYNGMYADKQKLIENKQILELKVAQKIKEFNTLIEDYWK